MRYQPPATNRAPKHRPHVPTAAQIANQRRRMEIVASYPTEGLDRAAANAQRAARTAALVAAGLVSPEVDV